MNRFSPFLVLLFVLGCSQYQTQPIRPVSQSTMPVSKSIVGQSNAAKAPKLTAWKTMFTDTRLRELIEVALKHNRDITMAVANVELTRATYRLKQASTAPLFGFSAGATFTKNAKNLARTDKVTQQYNAGVGLANYEVDFFNRVKNLNDEALANYFSSVEAQRTAKLSIIAGTAKAYYGYQSALAKLRLSDATLRAAKKTRALLKLRVNAGLSPQDVVNQTDAAIAQVQAQRAGVNQEKNTYQSVLIQLAGADIDRFLTKRSIGKNSLRLTVPANFSSTVLLNRPDVIGKELSLYATDANINAARAAFFPRVSLSSNMGFGSTELSKLFSLHSFLWQFAPSIRVPLFNEPTNIANLDLAKARKVIAVADYEKTIQAAFAEVFRFARNRDTLRQSSNSMRQAVVAQRRVLANTTARYDAGLINYVDVLSAQQSLYNLQINELNAMLAIRQNKVDLYKALGGGDDLDEKSRQAFFAALALRADERFPTQSTTPQTNAPQ